MNTSYLDKKLSAIIIDDESGAIHVLSRLLSRVGNVEVVASEQNPNLGLRHIMVLQPDIVFLDVQMDRKSGITLLKEIKELSSETEVIIVSGYDDYTFEAFKNGAADYLVKPVVLDELEKAISRIIKKKQEIIEDSDGESSVEELVEIRIAKDKGYLSANEILYLKASGSYTEIYTLSGKCEICTRGLWLLERELPDDFFRIHRSTIVNTKYIKSVSENDLKCHISSDELSLDLPVSKATVEVLEQTIQH